MTIQELCYRYSNKEIENNIIYKLFAFTERTDSLKILYCYMPRHALLVVSSITGQPMLLQDPCGEFFLTKNDAIKYQRDYEAKRKTFK